MNSEFKSDAKFFLVGIIGGIITLIAPVVVYNTWLLDYIDKHGKLVPYCLTPFLAMISAGIFVGCCYVEKPVDGLGPDGHQVNPFWGWALVALIIEVIIVALSNT